MIRAPRSSAPRILLPCLFAGFLLAACGDGGNDIAAPTTTTASDVPTIAPAPSPTTATSPPAVVEVVVADGTVEGGVRDVGVPLGEEVVLRVATDVADEVHVHGYDLSVDAVPGEVAELRFVADLPGVWEVELEDLGLELIALEVS